MQNLHLSARYRRCVVLAGSADWCRHGARTLLARAGLSPGVWLAGASPRLLGTETAALVVDAHAGFDPDAFGLASGTLRGGGVLVLLTPPLDQWPDFDDPQRQRIAVALRPPSETGGRFIERAVRILRADPDVQIVRQGEALPEPEAASPPPKPPGWRTDDQQHAVDAVVRVATGHRRRPVVLTADRGRGKSAAFGMAAAGLLQRGYKRVLVTAPRIDAVDALFAHAQGALGDVHARRGRIDWRDASIRFVAPDELLRTDHAADLLLVDEAAAIPAPLLTGLLRRYPRIAFATTVHGYEGTGRGFAVRFNRVLDRETRGWKALRLETPVRWAAGDPVERLVSDVLLLDAAAAADEDVADAAPDMCSVETLDRDRLVDDEATLSGLFGLLVLAHYRTRPFDLRHMLDGANIDIHVTRCRGHVVATAVVAREGGFDADTSRAIQAGETRPHGHLLPESLAAHLGLGQAPRLGCARVIRIAVHPAVQGRGLGAQLLDFVTGRARAAGLDYVGSSFGATPGLLRFWQRQDFLPVRLSIRRGAASGEHSAIVLKGLSSEGEQLVQRARERFARHFVHQLADPLRDVEAPLAAELLRGLPLLYPPRLDASDWQDLQAFAHGRRIYEACMGPLWELACSALAGDSPLQAEERMLLVACVLQRRTWQETAALAGLPGRRQVSEALRRIVAALLECYDADP